MKKFILFGLCLNSNLFSCACEEIIEAHYMYIRDIQMKYIKDHELDSYYYFVQGYQVACESILYDLYIDD